MKCPRCNEPMIEIEITGPKLDFDCPHCGAKGGKIAPILQLSRLLDDPQARYDDGKRLFQAVERAISDEQASLSYTGYLDLAETRAEAEERGQDPDQAVYMAIENGEMTYDTVNLDKLKQLRDLINWFITP